MEKKTGEKFRIGFICTGNSARSQMAEGFARYFASLYKKEVEIYSAGTNPEKRVHPLAVEVMNETGIKISHQKPKSLEEIPYRELDLIITLCGSPGEICPAIPGRKTEHWDLPDPAKREGTEEERKSFFRTIRDEIRKRVEKKMKEI